jgi:hypothetical protein
VSRASIDLRVAATKSTSQSLDTLPSIESLAVTSDYTVFMRPGVPMALRNAALRKLWRINPVYSQSDGLDADFLIHQK